MRAIPLRRTLFLVALSGTALANLSCGGDGGSPSPTPTSVQVTPGADTLVSVGETQAFAAMVLDANGDPIDGATIIWSSDAPSVLSMDPSSGVATALANGAAQVKATAGTLEGTASVFVAQIVTSVVVTPGNASLDGIGDTVRFSAVARDAGNTPVAGAQILWSINDHTVATIDTLGLATAKGPGTVLVSAQAQARAGYAALGVTQAAAAVAFTAAPAAGTAGQIFTSAVQVEIRDSNGQRVRNAQLPVTISVAGGAGVHGMVGTSVITTVDGVAAFQNLGVTRAGSRQLTANAPGVAPGVSATIAVAAAPPVKLAVVSLKDTMVAGDTLQARVEVQDQFDNQTTLSGLFVTVTLRSEPSPGFFLVAPLSGDASALIVNGAVTQFNGRVTGAGTGWELVATAVGYDSAFGGDATVLPGAPTRTLVYFGGLSSLAPWVGVGAAQSPGLTAYITDLFGNLTPTAPPTLLTVELLGWDYGDPGDVNLAQAVFGSLKGTTINGAVALGSIGFLRPGRTDVVATGGGLNPYGSPIVGRIYNKHGLTLGAKHACVVGAGGPYCWGDNTLRQITGGGIKDSVARPVIAGSAMVSVVAGGGHSCGLFSEGTAYCWGANASGQLGRSTVTASEPAIGIVVTVVKFKSLTAGANHTCGIGLTDSLAYCWGSNATGQLGDSTVASRNVPTLVKGSHKFIQLSAGTNHTCGVAAGALGLAWCWGRNQDGEGGHGAATPLVDSIPKLVGQDSNLVVLAGNGFNCAEYRTPTSQVQVRCWGSNASGRTGTDTVGFGAHPDPANVIGLGAIRPGSLTLGTDHACVVSPSSQLWCWGNNSHGQIKPGLSSTLATPLSPNITGNIPVGAVVVGGGTFTCALFPPSGFGATVGDTKCWGRANEGQLGHGQTTSPVIPPATAVQ